MMEGIVLGTFFILIGSSLVSGQVITHSNETSLRAALKSGYDSEVRPSTPTIIEVKYFLRSVQALDIADQSLSHTGFVSIIWEDTRLVWTPSSYGNLTSLDVKWAWRPLFIIVNGLETLDAYGGDDDNIRLMVFSNGSVLWQQAIHPTTVCDVNVVHFPYDVQSCQVMISFLGFTYNTDIAFNFTTVNNGIYLTNEEWTLRGSSLGLLLTPLCCPQTEIGSIIATFTFERLHTFYLNTFLIPTYLMSACLVWPFYLPTESGDRLGFALSILLSYTVILSVTADYLPTTSRQVPFVAGYLLAVLILCSIAVCNTAISTKLYFLETDPFKTLKTLYRKINPIVFLECKRKKVEPVKDRANANKGTPLVIDLETKHTEEKQPTAAGEEEEVTWAKITILLDRICLFLYSLAVVALNLSLAIYLG